MLAKALWNSQLHPPSLSLCSKTDRPYVLTIDPSAITQRRIFRVVKSDNGTTLEWFYLSWRLFTRDIDWYVRSTEILMSVVLRGYSWVRTERYALCCMIE
jgi:hypothetical protein